MENNGGLVKVDNLIAIEEELFPHVAWGYMNSKQYAVDKISTVVGDIHEGHRIRENVIMERFAKFGEQTEKLTNMMESNFHSIRQQLKEERATLESQLKEERKVILEQANSRNLSAFASTGRNCCGMPLNSRELKRSTAS